MAMAMAMTAAVVAATVVAGSLDSLAEAETRRTNECAALQEVAPMTVWRLASLMVNAWRWPQWVRWRSMQRRSGPQRARRRLE